MLIVTSVIDTVADAVGLNGGAISGVVGTVSADVAVVSVYDLF